MTSKFQPPPTWALPILVDEATKRAIFNPVWLKWFVDLSANLTASGAGSGGGSVTGPAGSIAGSLATFASTTGTVLSQGPLGTSTTVLHGNPSGAPAFSTVNLATDVGGMLPAARMSVQRTFLLMGA